MADGMMTEDRKWHLDKRVPVAIIVVLVVQLIGFGAVYGNLEGRVAALEKSNEKIEGAAAEVPERLARLEAIFERVERRLGRIEDRLTP